MTTQDIREQKFDKAAFGYKAEEVDQFLEQVCAYLEGLEGEKRSWRKKWPSWRRKSKSTARTRTA